MKFYVQPINNKTSTWLDWTDPRLASIDQCKMNNNVSFTYQPHLLSHNAPEDSKFLIGHTIVQKLRNLPQI